MNDTLSLDGQQLFDEDPDSPFMRQQGLANAMRRRAPIATPASGVETPPPQLDYRAMAYSALQQAQAAAQPSETENAALRDYAKQRNEQAQRDFQRGMVMRVMGGSSFAPIGDEVLRQALVAQGPEKIGGGVASGGQFFVDPEVAGQRRATGLVTQAKLWEAMAASDASLEQKREAARQAAELRREIASMNAGRASDRADQTQANRAFQQENALRDDFEKQVKDQRISIGTFPQIEAALSGTPSAASDMRAIFRYMKILDPTSVVREGEYATARNAAGVPAQVLNLYNRAATGTSLTPQQRADFLAQSRSERDTALKFFNERAAEFASRAQGYGLNPRNVILGYDGGGAGPAPSGAATPPGVSVRRKE